MKHFYSWMLAILFLGFANFSTAQNGPNLLRAKGTFSAPFVTPNTKADFCTRSGFNSYSPTGNIGNALEQLGNTGNSIPGSGYNYTAKKNGLQPEFTYTLIKNIGDANGGNCIKGDWRGQDHTGDGGYFMAVNGAPNSSKSPVFYKINAISVCAGTQYEFSAWVINMLPKSSSSANPGSEPNISFKVTSSQGSVIIANSGLIPYTNSPVWVKVTGTFTVPSMVSSVDLEVINATAVATGNDLGLDDISFSVKKSNISKTGLDGNEPPNALCAGSSSTVNFTLTDLTHTNTWYKWQVSTDGGDTYTDSTAPAQATFTGDDYTLTLNLDNVTTDMNGYRYKLVVSTSEAALANPTCSYVNEYHLIVNECGPTPVTLTRFNGKYNDGVAYLNWQTSQEINSDYFELYRSNDGQNFSMITTVKSAGNSQVLENYSYTDYAPGNSGYVYYKLKQVDLDGKFAFSNIVKLTTDQHSSVDVYPNPFSNQFTASFTANKAGSATLILRNTIGQPIYKQVVTTAKGSNTLLINNLPAMQPGVYYLSITSENINYVQKIQKK